jgi:hypothetical protein
MERTAFTIDVEGRQYIVTAKHVVATLKPGVENDIEILRKEGWSKLSVAMFPSDGPVDIAILIPPRQITASYALEPNSNGMFMGQEAYFVGFPYGLSTTYGNMPSVLPFVKRATVSQFVRPTPDTQLIELDGYNNPGFSGAPVVYQDLNSPGVVFRVAGVISGFIYDASPVIRKKQEIDQKDITKEDVERGDVVHSITDGRWYRIEDADELVKLNTGIAQAWAIGTAVELIGKHPIGPQVSDNNDLLMERTNNKQPRKMSPFTR